ncbi:MAG: glycosyltransferase family 4 protein [Caldilineaceae bacterium]|nr:glycosyltransferase family 4 protein [Caldilineaceae bacterium]
MKIGYLWQSETADMTQLSASVLHIKAVIQGLKERGHSVRMVSIPGRQHQWTEDLAQWTFINSQRPWAMRTVESGLRNIQNRFRLPYFNFFDSYHFSSAAVSALADCDVLYERYWLLNYGGLLTARRLGIPLVLEVNGDLIEEYAQLNIELSKAQWAAIHFINRRLFQGASHIVTVSEHLRQRTIERWGVDPAKVTTVANGAHVDVFALDQKIEKVRTRYHLNGEPTIAFVGSFKPWHGLDFLLDAFARVQSVAHNCKLVLVGDGPVRSELEAKVKDLQLEAQVIFTGKIEHQEVAELLQAVQIAVVNPRVSNASLAQSPLKLFEYMAAGKAIVAPSISTVEQILTHQVDAMLVPPNNVDALVNALLALIQNQELRLNLGQSAKQKALTNHSWARTAAEIETILTNLKRKLSPI